MWKIKTTLEQLFSNQKEPSATDLSDTNTFHGFYCSIYFKMKSELIKPNLLTSYKYFLGSLRRKKMSQKTKQTNVNTYFFLIIEKFAIMKRSSND